MADDLEIVDRIPGWEWNSGVTDLHIPIPESERAPEVGNEDRTTFANWRHRSDFIDVPDLRGRSLQEVEAEAARIKDGEYFKYFQEFQRCLDSWCVLNGRVAVKFKTRDDAWVRLCRFSTFGRKLNEGAATHLHPSDGRSVQDDWDAPAFGDNELSENDCNSLDESFDPALGGLKEVCTGMENSSQDISMQLNPQLQSFVHVHEVQQISESHSYAQTCRELPSIQESEGQGASITIQASIPENSVQQRLPLGDLHVNTLSHPAARRVPQPSELRCVVEHTREWLPNSFPTLPGANRPKKRKSSKTGAYGELSRFLCPNPDSGDHQDCPFRVRCSRLKKSGRFRITVCDLRHNCPRYKHKWRGPSQKAKWLGESLAPRVVRNVKVPVRELHSGFQMDYKKTANYQQLWRAKDLVRDWWAGGQRRSFHQIPALLERIKEVDPHCIVDWDTISANKIFKRAFVCPSATRDSLLYCQPVISLDAAYTKNRKYPSQLFVASILDGNYRVHILCYAIAPMENTENWTWFLELLSRSIHGCEDPRIPFVSDRQKGLHNAVRDVFPGKVHAHCCNHLRANVKKGHGVAAADFFIGCVYASTKDYFEKVLERLEKSTARGIAAVQYIKSIEPRNYARYAFPLPRLGKITSNPCEQANAGLLEIREFAPFRLLVELWLYIQRRFRIRYAEAMASHDVLTKQAQDRLEVNLRTHQQWQVLPDVHNVQAKIRTTDLSQEYLVTLFPRPACTCTELQEMLWPCQHIMAWDDLDGRDFISRFVDCWKVSSLRKLYEGSVPCFLSNDCGVCDTCFPPEVVVKKGRHRVVQIEKGARGSLRSHLSGQLGEDEFIDSEGNLFYRYPLADDPDQLNPILGEQSMDGGNPTPPIEGRRRGRDCPTGQRRKCSTCGQLGHNKRTCSRSSRVIPEERTVEQEECGPEIIQMNHWDVGQSSQLVTSTAPTLVNNTIIPEYETSEGEELEGVETQAVAIPSEATINEQLEEREAHAPATEQAIEDITGWDGAPFTSIEEINRWISWAS